MSEKSEPLETRYFLCDTCKQGKDWDDDYGDLTGEPCVNCESGNYGKVKRARVARPITEQSVLQPKWHWNKRTVTITFDLDWLLDFADTLNAWQSWTPWMDREDCKNWQRSLIARENKRESQTFGNCLSDVKMNLGRRQIIKLMELAKKRKR